jgi:hypothetical protein
MVWSRVRQITRTAPFRSGVSDRSRVQQEQTNDPAEIDDDHHGQHKDCGAEDKRPSIILVL